MKKKCLGPEGGGKRGRVKRLLCTCWCHEAEGNVSPTSFLEIRLRESKPMYKIVWVQKAEGSEAQSWLGSQGRVKRLFCTCWYHEAEGNVSPRSF